MLGQRAAAIDTALQAGPCVRVVVVEVRGSTPREVGAEMLVTPTETFGTIGGGQLEYLATERAARLLSTVAPAQPRLELELVPLGVARGQCCGGAVRLMFQTLVSEDRAFFAALAKHREHSDHLVTSMDRQRPFMLCASASGISLASPQSNGLDSKTTDSLLRTLTGTHARTDSLQFASNAYCPILVQPLNPGNVPVTIFGAGHVGRACAYALAPLGSSVVLIDNRRAMLADLAEYGIASHCASDPAARMREVAAGSFVLIMTHDHALDLALCEQALKRTDLGHIGLIGSATKRRRFLQRLRAASYSEQQLQRLNCPIGITSIRSKEPAAIAISVAAEYLQYRESKLAGDSRWQPLALAGSRTS